MGDRQIAAIEACVMSHYTTANRLDQAILEAVDNLVELRYAYGPPRQAEMSMATEEVRGALIDRYNQEQSTVDRVWHTLTPAQQDHLRKPELQKPRSRD